MVEADVDAAFCRHQVAVAYACAEQSVHAVAPVVQQPLRVDARPAQTVGIGHHRDRRLDHRDGIAVCEGHRRVREGGHQGAELLTVLRTLQNPGPRAAQECQRLQHLLHVRVMPDLVQPQVVVAPVGYACMPFQGVGRQVQVEEFDFLLDRFGEPIVHGRHRRSADHECVVFGLGAREARVDSEEVRTLAECRYRILAFPVRQRAPTGIGCDEIHQMGGARSAASPRR